MKRILLAIICLTFNNFIMAQLPCTKLFISEYIEGSNNNKAIEIYNPTSQAIDLTGYKVFVSYNGGNSTQTTDLTGTINPGGTHLLVKANADAALVNIANQIYTPSAWFNGDDAIALINTNTGDTLDIIGVIGEQPSSGGWDLTDGGSTKDNTIVRKPNVHVGQKNWSIGQSEWISYPANTYTYAGSHTMDPCPVITVPIISMVKIKQFVSEIDGTVDVKVSMQNTSPNPTSVSMSVLPGGTATEGADYTFPNPVTITFPAGSNDTQTVTIPIINDTDVETNEFFVLNISNPTNNALIDLSTDSIIIIDDDVAVNPPSVFFLFGTQNCAEEVSSCAVQVEIFGPNSNPTSVNVNLLLAQTTATPGVDFTFTNTTVTFPASSSTSQLVSVGITDDLIYEGNEAIALILANPTNNATIGTNNKTILTIVDNDPNSVFPITEGSFTIIPNPVKNYTVIAAPVYLEAMNVYNTLGQLVFNLNQMNSTSYYADFSELVSGTYIIELTTKSGQVLRHRMMKI
jgi:hypothetical protein